MHWSKQTQSTTSLRRDAELGVPFWRQSVPRAVSVLKKRTGAHENAIREFSIDKNGLQMGLPLDKFQGVLRGVPQYLGGSDAKL